MIDVNSPREPAKVVLDILQEELGLDDAHCLMGEQKWDIPPDQNLFLVAFDGGGPVVLSRSTFNVTSNPPSEIQQMTMMHDIRIEIMSYISNEARVRKEEVGMALESFHSRSVQELDNCQIYRIQHPVDASAAELTGQLIRYVAHVNVLTLHTKTKPIVPYFSKFNIPPGPLNPPEGTVNPPETTDNE